MKIFLDTIGCRLNQSEIESMARQFRAAGHQIVGEAALADLAVVNTCAVTGEAASDSRGRIRQISRAGVEQIVATGCWATLEPKKAAGLPKVSSVIPNQNKHHLVPQTLAVPAQQADCDLEPLERIPLPGLHRRTRAFIKVQDGCDNRCTFCITTVARGPGRSLPVADIIAEINYALSGGAKEVVLTGVHLGSWGADFSSSTHLRQLVLAILRETDIPRLRLSSLEPWDLDERFMGLWENPRLMPHLHLPLQSGCESTLRRMARKTTPNSFRRLVDSARSVKPHMAITTDVIAGFPGETDEEFSDSVEFVRSLQFAGGHVFSYSPRPGTGAARMSGQIPMPVRKLRNRLLHDAMEESARQYREAFIDQTVEVLWESTTELDEFGWRMEGLTGNYLRVSASASAPRWNQLDSVRLLALRGTVFDGIIRNS